MFPPMGKPEPMQMPLWYGVGWVGAKKPAKKGKKVAAAKK